MSDKIDTSGATTAMNAAKAATTGMGGMSGNSVANEAESAGSAVKESDVLAPKKPNKNEVIDTIEECDDLAIAVESVAAMYGIPSSYIVEDPVTDRMAVTRGHIVVPSNSPSKPSDNGKAIIQSIGAVLDYIAQRADDKLDQFQADHIRKGINQEKINDVIDPSKGNVVSSTIDANGDPVVIYDTGRADLKATKEAQEAFDDLKNGDVSYNADNSEYSYFKNEEDITNGMDISSTDMKVDTSTGNEPDMKIDSNIETNIPNDIKESAFLIDAIGQRGNTRHLGYEIMQEMGFDFVKPCDFFTESTARKNNRETVAVGIKHMKFDNTNLIKAIKLMNEARKEQTGERGKISLEMLLNNPKYQEAIDCLNKQFDARLNIRFIKSKEFGNREFTTIWNDIKTHLVISKSKGFQLGGLAIDIFVTNTALDEDAPDDTSLFGQHVISVFCHEIFHNIMAVLKSKEAQFTAALVETMTLAQDMPTASGRRKLITNFVNMTDEFGDLKMNVITKRAMVKHLTYLSTICHDEQALREYEKAVKRKDSKTIEDEMKRMERIIRKTKIHTYGPGRYFIPAIMTFVNFFAMVGVNSILGTLTFGLFFGIWVGTLAGSAISQGIEISTINKFKNGTVKNYEEHWCDMFAACYNLPVTFFMYGSPRKGVANDYSLEILNRYDSLEREAMQLMMIKYPTMNERNQSAVKYAKKTLESKAKLDPAVKKYMEWIVANYSKTLDMDIEEIYSKGTFDPKTAEDLDAHIEKLIGSANIKVTESDLSWLNEIGDSEYLF